MTYGPMRAMRTPCRLAAPDVARAGRTARGERRGGERGGGAIAGPRRPPLEEIVSTLRTGAPLSESSLVVGRSSQ